jgi:hypothetical protein
MQYKTIALELLRQRPELHDRLREERRLLAAVDRYSTELKSRHESWKEQLAQAKPGSHRNQIASEALEIALRELEDLLPPESSTDDAGPLSLDEAMAFLRRHTPSE